MALLVRRSSVAGPEEYCPRSGRVPLQVRRSTVPGPQNGTEPGTQRPKTRDGKSSDRERNGRGPATQSPQTGDATTEDRDGKLGDLGRKCGTGGLWRCRSGGVLSPVREMSRDRGRESGLESVWRRRSQGKVRTGDGTAADRGRKSGLHSVWCRRSRGKVRTGDGEVACRAYDVAGPREKYGPGTQRPRTGDRKSSDQGRKSGLESVWRRRSRGKVRTWDGTAADRGQKVK